MIFALLTAAFGAPLVVDMLDIGQGDAVLIRTKGKTALIDTGDKHGQVVEQLDRMGVRKIDLFFTSHPHSDHIGQMAEIIKRFDVQLVITSGQKHTTRTWLNGQAAIVEERVTHQRALRGQRIPLADDAMFTVLWPLDRYMAGTRSDLNSNSIVLLLDHEGHRFLFTGDSEADTERALVSSGLPDIDVLKVAHHGSEHSSTLSFLQTVKPEWAIISAGVDNKFGHPEKPALDRLESVGAHWLATNHHGPIKVISDGGLLSVYADSQEITNHKKVWAAAPVTVNYPAVHQAAPPPNTRAPTPTPQVHPTPAAITVQTPAAASVVTVQAPVAPPPQVVTPLRSGPPANRPPLPAPVNATKKQRRKARKAFLKWQRRQNTRAST